MKIVDLYRSKTDRTAGIEILRLLSMLAIVSLHVLSGSGNKGVIGLSQPFSLNWFVVWFMETFMCQAVDCFGIISGYVQCNKKVDLSRYVRFWIFVFLMNFCVFGITYLVGWKTFALKDIVFCIPWKAYLWYVQAYLGLILLMPVLNWIISNCWTRRSLFYVITIFILVPVIYGIDKFGIQNGYSTMWLCILYLVGGVLRKQEENGKNRNISWKILMTGELLLSVCILLTKIIPEYMHMRITGEYIEINKFLIYNSPLVVLHAICTFLLFTKLKSKSPAWFTLISSSSLGVYIVHKHPVFDSKMVASASNAFAELPLATMLANLILLIAEVFIISLSVSFVISPLCNYMSMHISLRITAMIGRIKAIWDKRRENDV